MHKKGKVNVNKGSNYKAEQDTRGVNLQKKQEITLQQMMINWNKSTFFFFCLCLVIFLRSLLFSLLFILFDNGDGGF